MTQSGIEPATFRLVAQCLARYRNNYCRGKAINTTRNLIKMSYPTLFFINVFGVNCVTTIMVSEKTAHNKQNSYTKCLNKTTRSSS
jgi:hypothetical protein